MGTVIKSKEGLIDGIFGRVTTFFPGESCLFCRGRISPEAIRLEGLRTKEREALVREGYAPELETNSPAVIMFTTAVAAQSVSELLHRLTGFMGEERRSTEVLFRFYETSIRTNREKRDGKCVCSRTELWGKGDSRRFLDLTWQPERTGPPI
jgi:hypothetical protein